MQNSEIVDKSQKLLEKIQNMLDSKSEIPTLVQQIEEIQQKKISDVTLIQVFYGTDSDRIQAAVTALNLILKHNDLPTEWIFVEAQKNKSAACFSWLKEYGINYVFVKTTSQQDKIFLKTPLWNIGADLAKSQKLCFIDTDVKFDNPHWLESASEALDKYDIISLSEKCAYDGENKSLQTSIGKKLSTVDIMHKQIDTFTHCGFTFGCTKNAFKQMCKFDCSLILDDIQTWAKIVGKDLSNAANKWLPFGVSQKFENGLLLKVGYIPGTCYHIFHGSVQERRYHQIVEIVKEHATYDDLLEYNPENSQSLPKWKNTQLAKFVKTALDSMYDYDSTVNGKTIWNDTLEKFGQIIDDNNPLVICIIFKKSFFYNSSWLSSFKQQLDAHLKQDFTFVCFTDLEDCQIEGIDIIPLSQEYKSSLEFQECQRQDVKFPKNSTIVLLSKDYIFQEDLYFYKNEKITLVK